MKAYLSTTCHKTPRQSSPRKGPKLGWHPPFRGLDMKKVSSFLFKEI